MNDAIVAASDVGMLAAARRFPSEGTFCLHARHTSNGPRELQAHDWAQLASLDTPIAVFTTLLDIAI